MKPSRLNRWTIFVPALLIMATYACAIARPRDTEVDALRSAITRLEAADPETQLRLAGDNGELRQQQCKQLEIRRTALTTTVAVLSASPAAGSKSDVVARLYELLKANHIEVLEDALGTQADAKPPQVGATLWQLQLSGGFADMLKTIQAISCAPAYGELHRLKMQAGDADATTWILLLWI